MAVDDRDSQDAGRLDADDQDAAGEDSLIGTNDDVDVIALSIELAGTNFREADLSGRDLSGADLTGADLTKADLTDARLDGANLTAAVLDGATLYNTSLMGANLVGASFADAYLADVNFSQADLTGARLTAEELDDVSFKGARLVRVDFGSVGVAKGIEDAADLTGTDLSRMDWDWWDESSAARRCRKKGAVGIEGFDCPQCAQWDGAEYGLDPSCETCGGTGLVGWDPEEEAASRPLTCPWCDGSGSFSSMASSWACAVCGGLGTAELWAIDRAAVQSEVGTEEWENGLESDPPVINEEGIDFSSQDFDNGHIEDATFTECDFAGVAFRAGELRDVTFIRCDLTDANFSKARLERVKFEQCQLAGSNWEDTQTEAVEFIDFGKLRF